MNLHDIILKGPFGEVRMNDCTDKSIAEWIEYGLKQGATSFETMPSDDTLRA